MLHTHICEGCAEEYNNPLTTTCTICHGELLEQTILDLEVYHVKN